MDLALFDFDGTITQSDSFIPFLRFACSQWRWLAGSSLLSPVLLAYRYGALPPSAARQSAAFVALVGRREADLYRLGAEFCARALAKNLRDEALGQLAWHQKRGDRVVVVSASLNLYLEPWCEARQLELLCTRLSFVRGRSTGAFRGRDCSGEEKARRVRRLVDLSRFETVWAYGDTPEDFPLLRLASEKWYRGQRLDDIPRS